MGCNQQGGQVAFGGWTTNGRDRRGRDRDLRPRQHAPAAGPGPRAAPREQDALRFPVQVREGGGPARARGPARGDRRQAARGGRLPALDVPEMGEDLAPLVTGHPPPSDTEPPGAPAAGSAVPFPVVPLRGPERPAAVGGPARWTRERRASCRRRGSNSHSRDFKSRASPGWATPATTILPRRAGLRNGARARLPARMGA